MRRRAQEGNGGVQMRYAMLHGEIQPLVDAIRPGWCEHPVMDPPSDL